MEKRRAEIAGAGIAGLTLASALAQDGWSVRLHEKGDRLREIGAGIYLWENALKALEWIGAYDEAIANGEAVQAPQLRDHRNKVIQEEWLNHARLFTVARRDLHQALVNTAERSGVDIVTSSQAVGADPAGRLRLEGGQEFEADLVVGTDGVYSKVRDSLNLAKSVENLGDGCGRHMIPRNSDDPVGTAWETWNGGRRIGVVPCHPEWTYIFVCGPLTDLRATDQRPFDRETWIESFPQFKSQLNRIPEYPEGWFAPFHDVRAYAWRKGHVAIVGDAAHAMSPNLGQAACVAMQNGIALAQALRGRDVRDALRLWEESERPVIDRVQDYSRIYGKVGTRWPGSTLALDARTQLLKRVGKFKPVQHRIQFAQGYFPCIPAA